jgi:hypothetical protein
MFRTILFLATIYGIYYVYSNSGYMFQYLLNWYMQNTGIAIIIISILIMYMMKYQSEFMYNIIDLLRGVTSSGRISRMNTGYNVDRFVSNTNKPTQYKKTKRSVSPLMKKKIGARQMWKCNKCSAMLDETYEVNHIIPLEKGGSNGQENLEALCRTCHGKISINDILKRTG